MLSVTRIEELLDYATDYGRLTAATAETDLRRDNIIALEMARDVAVLRQWIDSTPASKSDWTANFITALADEIHADNVKAGWWTDPVTGDDLHGKRNVPEMLCLVHSEISEAMEGYRKGLADDKLTHRPMFRVELIDALIRIFDILGSEFNDDHPAGAIFQEKRAYNANRADHKLENRLKAGGKKF